MPSGGARKGAGRRLGGANREKPLAYMLRVMRDPDAPAERRDRMAIAAAPFCHPIIGAKLEASAPPSVDPPSD
jgi:hypothetical protein